MSLRGRWAEEDRRASSLRVKVPLAERKWFSRRAKPGVFSRSIQPGYDRKGRPPLRVRWVTKHMTAFELAAYRRKVRFMKEKSLRVCGSEITYSADLRTLVFHYHRPAHRSGDVLGELSLAELIARFRISKADLAGAYQDAVRIVRKQAERDATRGFGREEIAIVRRELREKEKAKRAAKQGPKLRSHDEFIAEAERLTAGQAPEDNPQDDIPEEEE